MTPPLATLRPVDGLTSGHSPSLHSHTSLRRRLDLRGRSARAPGRGASFRASLQGLAGPAAWLMLAALAAAPAAASGPAAPARPAAWQAEAPVPAVRHESAFSTYRPHVDTPVGDWRAANEAVNRIGGWRAYGREAGAPLQPLPPVGPARPAPAAGGSR